MCVAQLVADDEVVSRPHAAARFQTDTTPASDYQAGKTIDVNESGTWEKEIVRPRSKTSQVASSVQRE